MRPLYRIHVVLLFIVGLLPVAVSLADDKGQGDLDQAIELQLTARTPADLMRVVELCESALKKGLGEDNVGFAKQLISSTLLQHARRLSPAGVGAAATKESALEATPR